MTEASKYRNSIEMFSVFLDTLARHLKQWTNSIWDTKLWNLDVPISGKHGRIFVLIRHLQLYVYLDILVSTNTWTYFEFFLKYVRIRPYVFQKYECVFPKYDWSKGKYAHACLRAIGSTIKLITMTYNTKPFSAMISLLVLFIYRNLNYAESFLVFSVRHRRVVYRFRSQW